MKGDLTPFLSSCAALEVRVALIVSMCDVIDDVKTITRKELVNQHLIAAMRQWVYHVTEGSKSDIAHDITIYTSYS